MTKELTAIEWLNFYKGIIHESGFKIIETALYDLTRLQKLFNQYAEDNKRMREYIDMVDKTFVDVETTKKKLKALEIIKKKRVDVDSLLYYIKSNACDDSVVCWYNEYIVEFDDERILTQVEYDLLKEVLLWLKN